MKIVLDLNDASTVRCVGVWIHVAFSVPQAEITADTLSRLMAREDWQKAFWAHVNHALWREANEKSQMFTGKELPDKPDLKTWMRSSLNRFNSLWQALQDAGFSVPPSGPEDQRKVEGFFDLLTK